MRYIHTEDEVPDPGTETLIPLYLSFTISSPLGGNRPKVYPGGIKMDRPASFDFLFMQRLGRLHLLKVGGRLRNAETLRHYEEPAIGPPATVKERTRGYSPWCWDASIRMETLQICRSDIMEEKQYSIFQLFLPFEENG